MLSVPVDIWHRSFVAYMHDLLGDTVELQFLVIKFGPNLHCTMLHDARI